MSDFLQFMGIIVIFGSILFLAYIAARLVGKKASASMQSRHMQVVEQISVGLDKRLILVRVGNEHFLFLSGKKEFRQVAKVKLDMEETEAPQQSKGSDEPIFDFRQIFEKYISHDGKKQVRNIRKDADSGRQKDETLKKNIRRLEQLRENSYDKEV